MGVEGFMDWRSNSIDKGRHGGAKATWFIYFMVATANMAYFPSVLNMVTYLHDTMHMGVASSSTSVTNLIGGTCAFALLGAFISDSYITRFKTILIFAPFEFLGFGLLALQAHLPSLQPPQCDTIEWTGCTHVQGYHAILLYLAMYIVALGEGGIRANLASFGGDQFDDGDFIESRLKSSFFNWFTVGISVGLIAGLILVVWVQNKKGWNYGFAFSACIILLGLLVLGSGFSFYRNQIPRGSPLTRMLQVFVGAVRNRKLVANENEELYQEYGDEELVEEEKLAHTKGLKWLDKASFTNRNTGNWYRCPVDHVEEMKIIIRMLPIVVTSVFGYLPVLQLLTFTVQQGNTMENKLWGTHISTVSLIIIPIIFQMVILLAYDRFFVPFARRITGCPTGITQLQRVGVGFISIIVATSVAAIIERTRKMIAKEHGLLDSGARVPMSVLWLGFQFFVLSINDAFAFVGLLEFFNAEASRGMKSIGTAIFWCVLGLASLMGSLLVQVVNKASKIEDGEMGWLEGNSLNKSHLDRYYWLLSIIGFVAFLNYLYWAKRYVYRQQQTHALGS